MRGLEPAGNAEPARWLLERLTTFGENVLSVVPSGFEAYARVFHPASRVTHTSEAPLRWAEVAALTGRTAHRAMQWPSLRGANPVLYNESLLEPSAIWVRGPEEGTLPLTVAQTLWSVLRRHTNTDKTFLPFGKVSVFCRGQFWTRPRLSYPSGVFISLRGRSRPSGRPFVRTTPTKPLAQVRLWLTTLPKNASRMSKQDLQSRTLP